MDSYIVILKSYDSVSIFRTKEYNDDVVSLLNWYIGSSFDVTAVFKNAEPIVIGEFVFQTKKEVIDELEWKKYMWFDEEGEELEEKIRKLLMFFMRKVKSMNRIEKLMDSVNEEVYQERLRQNEKWGIQRHPIGTWLSILGEEFGEVCQAAQSELGLASVKDTDADDLYMECIHVAAVASAIAEQIKEQQSLKEVA